MKNIILSITFIFALLANIASAWAGDNCNDATYKIVTPDNAAHCFAAENRGDLDGKSIVWDDNGTPKVITIVDGKHNSLNQNFYQGTMLQNGQVINCSTGKNEISFDNPDLLMVFEEPITNDMAKIACWDFMTKGRNLIHPDEEVSESADQG